MIGRTGKTHDVPSFAIRAREALLARILPAPFFVRRDYKRRTGKTLNLKDPKTFNEKLQWLKLYNRDPKLTEFVDKYRVKEFVSRTVGSEYVVPTAGLFERAEDIKLSELPKKCILKATHGSAWNIIIDDKRAADEKYIQAYFRKRLKRSYYTYSREWAYKNVKPRVICEELILDECGKLPNDYKVFCFNGTPVFVGVDFDRSINTTRVVYDFNWKATGFSVTYPPSEKTKERPVALEEIYKISENIASVAPFVRVDFYVHFDRPYIGEITLYPGNGMNIFYPEEVDDKFGAMLNISQLIISSGTA